MPMFGRFSEVLGGKGCRLIAVLGLYTLEDIWKVGQLSDYKQLSDSLRLHPLDNANRLLLVALCRDWSSSSCRGSDGSGLFKK